MVRLARLLSGLKAVGVEQGVRNRTVAEKTGYTEKTVGNILSGNAKLTDRFINAVCIGFDIRVEWVQNGENPVLNKTTMEARRILDFALNINSHKTVSDSQPAHKEPESPTDLILKAKAAAEKIIAMAGGSDVTDAEFDAVQNELFALSNKYPGIKASANKPAGAMNANQLRAYADELEKLEKIIGSNILTLPQLKIVTKFIIELTSSDVPGT